MGLGLEFGDFWVKFWEGIVDKGLASVEGELIRSHFRAPSAESNFSWCLLLVIRDWL